MKYPKPNKPKQKREPVPEDHKILRMKAAVWDAEKHDRGALNQLINDMLWIIGGEKAWGLAAPQLGISLRVVVMAIPQRLAFVNPKVIRGVGKSLGDEACLSFPGKKVEIERSAIVSIMSEDAFTGKTYRMTFTGDEARCIQHEIDHLDGIVITDYADDSGHETAEESLTG